MSDVKDRAIAERRLEEQARQGDLDRDGLASYRQGQLDNTAERNRINGVTAEANLLREKNNETRFSQDGTRIEAEAGLKKAQTATLTDAQAYSGSLASSRFCGLGGASEKRRSALRCCN